MEKGNIKIVEIADFKNSEHVLDYVDNDFVIIIWREAPTMKIQ